MTLTRRRALALGLSAPALALGHRALAGPSYGDLALGTGEWLSYRIHRLIGANALAREYPEEAISAHFPPNGTTLPTDIAYLQHLTSDFAAWHLEVGGLVARPQRLSLDALRSMPARTQITRHDCVEGWSAIASWTGVQLGTVLDRAGLLNDARFIVFHCYDKLNGFPYYESIDLVDAVHPQTILAYGMNGAPLTLDYGAPLRLRVERQLGYKHAKYLKRIVAVASLAHIGMGRGGAWEDLANYEWYAGI